MHCLDAISQGDVYQNPLAKKATTSGLSDEAADGGSTNRLSSRASSLLGSLPAVTRAYASVDRADEQVTRGRRPLSPRPFLIGAERVDGTVGLQRFKAEGNAAQYFAFRSLWCSRHSSKRKGFMCKNVWKCSFVVAVPSVSVAFHSPSQVERFNHFNWDDQVGESVPGLPRINSLFRNMGTASEGCEYAGNCVRIPSFGGGVPIVSSSSFNPSRASPSAAGL